MSYSPFRENDSSYFNVPSWMNASVAVKIFGKQISDSGKLNRARGLERFEKKSSRRSKVKSEKRKTISLSNKKRKQLIRENTWRAVSF